MLAIQRFAVSVAAVFGLGSIQAACGSAEALPDPQAVCDSLFNLVKGGQTLRDGPLDSKKPSTILRWERWADPQKSGKQCELQIGKEVGKEDFKVPGAGGAKGGWHEMEFLFLAEGACDDFDTSCALDGALVVQTPRDGKVVFRQGDDPFSVDVTFPGGQVHDLQPE